MYAKDAAIELSKAGPVDPVVETLRAHHRFKLLFDRFPRVHVRGTHNLDTTFAQFFNRHTNPDFTLGSNWEGVSLRVPPGCAPEQKTQSSTNVTIGNNIITALVRNVYVVRRIYWEAGLTLALQLKENE